MEENNALITNDAVVFGLLMIILGVVFKTSTSDSKFLKKFYTYVPSVLLCYFIPSIFNSLNIISGESSRLYFVASRYMLPAALVLLTLSIDIEEIKKLGKKAIIMFLTGTVGIVIGGPLSILFFSWLAPSIVGGSVDEVWRGMTTVAGSWIGGTANQTAMREVFEVDDQLFSKMVTVDVLVANLWMAVLLIGAGRSSAIDKFLKADASAIEDVKRKVIAYQAGISRIPTMSDLLLLLAVGSGATGISHFCADIIAPFIASSYPYLAKYSLTSGFFWLVVIATTIGLMLSFTKVKKMEGVGASKLGSVFVYILVATVGMQMDLVAIIESPGLFLIGAVWMLVHVILLLIVAKIIRAPFFFVAVGSQANVGGAASAPIIASAFHPSLAPVGVLLAVLGYALGTYGAYLCGVLMQLVSTS